VLNVFDSGENCGTDARNVTVRDITSPVANAGSNITVEQYDTLTFDGTKSSDNVGITNYTWTFNYNDSDIILYGPHPPFFFDTPGNYTITLRVRDAAALWCEDPVLVKVVDNEKPHADGGCNIITNSSDIVRFNGSGSRDNVGIVNYTWIFTYNGIPVTLYGPDPSFRFDMQGNYTITLKVIDGRGNADEDGFNITVIPATESKVVKEEEDFGVYGWGGIIAVMMLVLVLAGVIAYIIRKKKKEKVEQSFEDEFGRVERFR